MRVPLAWLSLTHSKRRLLGSLAGIVGAVLLMVVEFGFLNALRDSQVELIRSLDADLVMVNRLKLTVTDNVTFPRRRLYQALAVAGVRAAEPLHMEIESAFWKNPNDGSARVIRVLAFDPDHSVFRNADITRARAALKQPDTAAFDMRSRSAYGDTRPGTRAELAHRTVRVVGLFALGTDFVSDGTVVMSDKSFARFFPSRATPGGTLETAELGVLRLAPGADVAVVRTMLRARLPDDVALFTKDELAATEQAYWENTVPIGYVFGLGASLGFVIGVMICYQILFTNVTDQLPQFATLKAIGYTNRYVLSVVVQEALLLSVLGFVPGVAIGELVYRWLAYATGLPMHLTFNRFGLVFLLTSAMATISAFIAAREALAVDPAEVFE